MLSERNLASGGAWIDLLDPTDEEIARVRSAHNIRVPPRSEMEEIESSSRLSRDGDVLYMNVPVATVDDGDGKLLPSPVGFILSDEILVTVHFAKLHTTSAVLARLEADKKPVSSADVFAMMIEGMVDFGADQLESIAADLTGISQRVFRRTDTPRRNVALKNRLLRRMLSAIGYAGEHLSQIRESLLGLQRIINFTTETCRDWRNRAFLESLETARRDLQSLIDYETHLSDKAQFLLDANLGFISTEQNEIFKVLTIVSVVGIPPTLVASMYGMNFHFMPELSWHLGYLYGLAVIAISTLIPILWFKWRGWW
jgi:magnesium transporter